MWPPLTVEEAHHNTAAMTQDSPSSDSRKPRRTKGRLASAVAVSFKYVSLCRIVELRPIRLPISRTHHSSMNFSALKVPETFAESIKTTQRPVGVYRVTVSLSSGFMLQVS